MIYHINPLISIGDFSVLQSQLTARRSGTQLPAYCFRRSDAIVVVCNKLDNMPLIMKNNLLAEFDTDGGYQLCSRKYKSETSRFYLGDLLVGDGNSTIIVGGPCAVESPEQMLEVCDTVLGEGLHVVRGSCFKPRTSMYSFQGLGESGVNIVKKAVSGKKLLISSEICSVKQLDDVLQIADVVQIGAKSMYDYDLLRECATLERPVILKRHYGSRLEEFAQMADLLMSRGKENIILCERGIRTFETSTRFTLDLCGVEWLKKNLRLPVFVDPSHAMGAAYGVSGLACAAMAQGVDGIIIETHPSPAEALSDSKQQLTLDEFRRLCGKLKTIGAAIGRQVL